MVLILAFSLQDQVEKYGAYVGLAAFIGLAVLSLLYFAQARELKRLRDWAGRAPERAQELEARVVAQAEEALSERGGRGRAGAAGRGPRAGHRQRQPSTPVPVPMGPRPAVAVAAAAAAPPPPRPPCRPSWPSPSRPTADARAEPAKAPTSRGRAAATEPPTRRAGGGRRSPRSRATASRPSRPPRSRARRRARSPSPQPRPAPAAAPLRASTTRSTTLPPAAPDPALRPRRLAHGHLHLRRHRRAGHRDLRPRLLHGPLGRRSRRRRRTARRSPAAPPPTSQAGAGEAAAEVRPDKVVVVLNGTSIDGLASQQRDKLIDAGYADGMIRIDNSDDQQRQDSARPLRGGRAAAGARRGAAARHHAHRADRRGDPGAGRQLGRDGHPPGGRRGRPRRRQVARR